MHIVDAVRGLLYFWRDGDRLSARTGICFVITLVLLCIACVLIGTVPSFVYPWDDFFLLENGWRFMNGLRPYLDFWSPWGPVTFTIVGLGLKFCHASPNGIAYGNAIFAALVGCWTYAIASKRLTPIPRALLGIYAAALACSPYPLGMTPMALSDAMAYNRYGYALLMPVLVECFPSLRVRNLKLYTLAGGVSTGIAVALLLFLKASYFLIAFGLVCISLIGRSLSSRRLPGILVGLSVGSLLPFAYLRFDIMSMLQGLRMAAGARVQSLSIASGIYNLGFFSSALLGIVVLSVLVSLLQPQSARDLGGYRLMLAGIVYLFDVALLTTNHQPSGLPLVGAYAIILSDYLPDPAVISSAIGEHYALASYTSVLLVAGLLFVPQLTSDLLAFPIAAIRKIHPSSTCSARLNESRVASLVLCDSGFASDTSTQAGSSYTRYINDGVALLEQQASPKDKVLTMDFQNPFPYVMGWAPPRGGFASMAYNYTLSDRFHPSADSYFGDATIVMVPKRPVALPQHYDPFYHLYSADLEYRFRLVAESEWFRLYRRRN